ncbi:Presenilin [Entamoeba marina]
MSQSIFFDVPYEKLNDDTLLTDIEKSSLSQDNETIIIPPPPNTNVITDIEDITTKTSKTNHSKQKRTKHSKKHRHKQKRVTKHKKSSSIEDGEVITFEEYCNNVKSVLIPVAITLFCTVIIIKILHLSDSAYMSTASLIFSAEMQDSLTIPIWLLAILSALIFVTMIVIVTFLFVLLFYYKCMKIMIGWLLFSVSLLLLMFGGTILRNILIVFNSVMDWFTFIFLLVNFAVLGVISIFYVSPMKLNQFFMITISVFMASFFSNLPEWTTWMVLISMALYDLVAVLCPKGPLKILVTLAQERNEPIPALVYSTAVWLGMVNNETDEINTGDSNQFTISSKKGKGVKLGLGDFVFYSVLVGRCALYDLTIVFSASIAVLSGLQYIFLSRWCIVPFIITSTINGYII